MKDLKPKHIHESVMESFRAVFSGEATNGQFIKAFLALATAGLVIVLFFIIITRGL